MQRYNLVYRLLQKDLDVTTWKCKKIIHFSSKKRHWNRSENGFFFWYHLFKNSLVRNARDVRRTEYINKIHMNICNVRFCIHGRCFIPLPYFPFQPQQFSTSTLTFVLLFLEDISYTPSPPTSTFHQRVSLIFLLFFQL